MGECDPGAPLTDQASSDRYPDYTHASFAYKLKVQLLPSDQEKRGEFDNGVDFRIRDPNVHFRLLQTHMKLLRMLANLTVYVLVDNRDLTYLDNPDPSLYSIGLQWQPGGPAVLACRALLESSVTWCSSPSAKPVVFTWSTTHEQAPRPGISLPGLSWSPHCAP